MVWSVQISLRGLQGHCGTILGGSWESTGVLLAVGYGLRQWSLQKIRIGQGQGQAEQTENIRNVRMV